MYVVILVFDLVWLYNYRAESSVRELLLRPAVVIVLTIVTPALAAAAVWYRRRLQRELKNLVRLADRAGLVARAASVHHYCAVVVVFPSSRIALSASRSSRFGSFTTLQSFPNIIVG